MTPNEDPAAQPAGEAADPERPADDLEDWLSDLRTEVAADPPGWIDDEPAAPPMSEPSGGGRHRAPE